MSPRKRKKCHFQIETLERRIALSYLEGVPTAPAVVAPKPGGASQPLLRSGDRSDHVKDLQGSGSVHVQSMWVHPRVSAPWTSPTFSPLVPGRAAINNFQHGRWGLGLVDANLAVAEVLPGVGTTIVKAVVKAGVKSGPGPVEGLIPFWGNARAAVNHFYHISQGDRRLNRWVFGLADTVLAVTDVLDVGTSTGAEDGLKVAVKVTGKEAAAAEATPKAEHILKEGESLRKKPRRRPSPGQGSRGDGRVLAQGSRGEGRVLARISPRRRASTCRKEAEAKGEYFKEVKAKGEYFLKKGAAKGEYFLKKGAAEFKHFSMKFVESQILKETRKEIEAKFEYLRKEIEAKGEYVLKKGAARGEYFKEVKAKGEYFLKKGAAKGEYFGKKAGKKVVEYLFSPWKPTHAAINHFQHGRRGLGLVETAQATSRVKNVVTTDSARTSVTTAAKPIRKRSDAGVCGQSSPSSRRPPRGTSLTPTGPGIL